MENLYLQIIEALSKAKNDDINSFCDTENLYNFLKKIEALFSNPISLSEFEKFIKKEQIDIEHEINNRNSYLNYNSKLTINLRDGLDNAKNEIDSFQDFFYSNDVNKKGNISFDFTNLVSNNENFSSLFLGYFYLLLKENGFIKTTKIGVEDDWKIEDKLFSKVKSVIKKYIGKSKYILKSNINKFSPTIDLYIDKIHNNHIYYASFAQILSSLYIERKYPMIYSMYTYNRYHADRTKIECSIKFHHFNLPKSTLDTYLDRKRIPKGYPIENIYYSISYIKDIINMIDIIYDEINNTYKKFLLNEYENCDNDILYCMFNLFTLQDVKDHYHYVVNLTSKCLRNSKAIDTFLTTMNICRLMLMDVFLYKKEEKFFNVNLGLLGFFVYLKDVNSGIMIFENETNPTITNKELELMYDNVDNCVKEGMHCTPFNTKYAINKEYEIYLTEEFGGDRKNVDFYYDINKFIVDIINHFKNIYQESGQELIYDLSFADESYKFIENYNGRNYGRA